MGVYIPNMEKPKTCEDCPCAYFTEGAYSDECQVTHKHITDEKPTDCPLVEIPTPHGRLIDGDLVADMLDSMMAHGTLNRAYDEVMDAPTILEAEE